MTDAASTPQVGSDAQIAEQVKALADEIRYHSSQLARMSAHLDEIRSLVGPFGISFPEDTVLVQTIHGNKYFADAMDDVMTPQLVVYRQWERDLSELFLALTTPDTTFVDIGANIGYFTVLVASRIGRGGTGKVFAVEANPVISRLLKRNVHINWSMCPVEVFEMAVGDKAGVVRLYAPQRGAANASLSRASEGGSVREFVVEMKKVDDLIPSGIKASIMKIDVEGFELAVMNGADALVRRSPDLTLITEWSVNQMRAAEVEPASVIDKIESWGMTIHILPENVKEFLSNKSKFRVSRDVLLDTPYANLVMCRTPSP